MRKHGECLVPMESLPRAARDIGSFDIRWTVILGGVQQDSSTLMELLPQ